MERKEITLPGFEGLYYIYEDGSVFSVRKQRFLKPHIREGYNYVMHYLSAHDKSQSRWFYVHHLVALHWLGICPRGKEINHKDHNKANNHYTNLEYSTHQQNALKAYRNNGIECHWVLNLTLPESVISRMESSNARLKPCEAVNTETGKILPFSCIDSLCRELNVNRRTFNRHIRDRSAYKGKYVFSYQECQI
jgi:hypothetical protein